MATNDKDLFVYDWKSEEITMPGNWHTELRFYCLDEDNKNVCVRLHDFRTRIVLEFTDSDYLLNNYSSIKGRLCSLVYNRQDHGRCRLVYKRRLYGCHLNEDRSHKLFPFIEMGFTSRIGMYSMRKRLTTLGFPCEVKIHELVSPEIQFIIDSGVSAAGWLTLKNPCRVPVDEMVSSCDLEYKVFCDQVVSCDRNDPVYPKIMAWDIEAFCKDIGKNPGKDVDDCVFQISCVFSRLQGERPDKYLLTLGKCDRFDDETHVLRFDDERALILGFTKLVKQQQPNIITGWNIFNFDFSFMIARAEHNMCLGEFTMFGMVEGEGAVVNLKWASKAHNTTNINYIAAEGVLPIDLIEVVRKAYKLSSYSLNNVANEFLHEAKDDVSFPELLSAYRDYLDDNDRHPQTFARVGKYCVQDSKLVVDLFDKLMTWISISEMAKTTSTPIINVHTNGEQKKFYSQVLKYCRPRDIVVESNGYKASATDRYTGALVLAPKPGLYEYVSSIDFASLYPSIIEAYNLDYTTMVTDSDTVPDDDCYVFEWEDHVGCQHDPETKTKNPMCQKNHFRFLREDIYGKGVIPTIVEDLLTARRNTRAQMKSITDPEIKAIMNQRQLSYKIAANSMYGATGVKSGALPFMPVAMCTTYMGRESISKAVRIVQAAGASIVYGDTDSNYVTFSNITGTHEEKCQQVWDRSIELASHVSRFFKHPMKIEFEEAIYNKFMILTKKRYMYYSCTKEGKQAEKIKHKGVLLARRDNSGYVKSVYEDVVKSVFAGASKEETLGMISDRVLMLMTRQVDPLKLSITKSVNDYNYGEVTKDDEGSYKMGAYKAKEPPQECVDKAKYWKQAAPAQVQLDMKIVSRGEQRTEGSRLEYVVVENKRSKKQADKIEDYSYYIRNSTEYRLDYQYYADHLVNPIEQIFDSVFGTRRAVERLVGQFELKRKCMADIKRLFSPVLRV